MITAKPLLPLLFLCLAPLAATVTGQSSSPAWTEVTDSQLSLMGDWRGSWLDAPDEHYHGINPRFSAQVIAVGPERYRVRFFQDFDRRANVYFEGEGDVRDGRIEIEQEGWKVSVSPDEMVGSRQAGEGRISFEMRRVERASPTLGLEAPQGAVALLDGSSLDAWEHTDERAVTWKLLEDGSMEIEPSSEHRGADPAIGGDIRSKQGFGDVRVHLEFRYPVEADRQGQGRGNSGLFFQDAYEVQILNSYGLEGYWNECGAMYKMSPPKVNATLPPLQWQTYDVDYRAARFSDDGEVAENPRITVRLNGVLIHNDEELVHHTSYRLADRFRPVPSEPGPIRLQDHSNRIQFRNIWALPLED